MFLPQNNSYLKHFSECFFLEVGECTKNVASDSVNLYSKYVTQSEPHLAFKGIVIYWAISRVNINCEPWFGISMEYQVQRK